MKHSLGSPKRLAALRGLTGEVPSGLFCCPQPLSLVHTLAYSVPLVFIFCSKAALGIEEGFLLLVDILLSVGNLGVWQGDL